MTDDDRIIRLNEALEGRYRIERELGEGGMATVYRADDLKHGRKVALKVLKPELAAVVGADRFLAEITTTANLQHPHILPLFDSGDSGPFIFYVMPYVAGESLRARLDREKQLGVDEALGLTRKIAGALDHAHERGVVHRDIKPGNILLSDQGEPLVADFGIALAVAQAGGGRITETGLSLGTPHYMSPEQATGDRDVDRRTDVYALGCVLYEMLTGDPPFSASTAQAVLAKILTMDAPSLTAARRTVPPNVGAAVAKALEKLPADRFDGAGAFGAALADPGFRYATRRRPATRGGGSGAVGEGVGAGAAGVHRTVSWIASVVTVAALGMAAWGWLRPIPAPPTTRAELTGVPSLLGMGEVIVSPDGTKLAVAGAALREPMYWRASDEDSFRPVPGSTGAEYASFSPDGHSLIFSTFGGGAIERVVLPGGAPQSLIPLPTPDAAGLHWAQDGSIVYSLADGRGLYRIAPDADSAQRLLDDSVRVRNPKVLPGGTAVIFTDPDERSTRVLDLRTGSVRMLLPGGFDATWVDTGHLLYADAGGSLWGIPFDPDAARITGEAVELMTEITINGFFGRFTVSENGILVFGMGLADVTNEPVASIVDLAGNRSPLARRLGEVGWVRWSPDGSSIVYVRTEDEEEQQIWIYDVESDTEPRQLTFEGRNASPVFSPDGSRVAFASQREDTDGADIFIKTVNDDATETLLEARVGHQVPTDWPADTLLMFENILPDALPALWTLDPTTGSLDGAREYARSDEASLFVGRIAMGSGLVAYLSSGAEDVIFVRGFPRAGTPLRLPGGGAAADWPSWSASGDTVRYWATPRDGRDALSYWEAHLGLEPTVVRSSRELFSIEGGETLPADLHPDGDRLLIVETVRSVGRPERFIVLTNWFEVLRRRMGDG